MAMHLHASSSPRSSRGVSLVELLVGVAIGLIGTVAIFQAVGAWTKHTQTAGAGGDAQMAGTLALFNLERDIKEAGHGFGMALAPVMGCNVQANDSTRGAPAFNFPLNPVNIVVGAGGAPDVINVLYGNSSFFVQAGTFDLSTPATKRLARRGGFRPGDLAIVADSGGALPGSANCQLIEVTGDANPDGLTIDHAVGGYNNFYTGAVGQPSRYNVAAGPVFATGTIYDLGPNPILNSWQITNNGHVLSRTEQIANSATQLPVSDGVINVKAQYGVDINNDGQIATAEWTNVAPANFRTVLAVRVSVLVRSRQFERNGDTDATVTKAITPTARNPTYFGLPANTFLMTNVDGTPDAFDDNAAVPNNWRYYRYHVYERVIPLRNMLWGIFG